MTISKYLLIALFMGLFGKSKEPYRFIIKGADKIENIEIVDFDKAVKEFNQFEFVDKITTNVPPGMTFSVPVKEDERAAKYIGSNDKEIIFHLKEGVVLLIYQPKEKQFREIIEKFSEAIGGNPYPEMKGYTKFEELYDRVGD